MLVHVTQNQRIELLNQIRSIAAPGDILRFYHRTSWRSRLIKLITRCEKPHLCIYAGKDEIIGMLKGRVRRHRVGRFLRPEYDLEIVRGDPEILRSVRKFLNQKESKRDLGIIWGMLICNYIFRGDVRNIFPYQMAGVTCSGIVSAAIHKVYTIKSCHPPLMDTPKDAEVLIRKIGLPTLIKLELVRETLRPNVQLTGARR